MNILLSADFFKFIKDHSDLYIGYIASLFGGTTGIGLIILTSPMWTMFATFAGIILTLSSIVLTIFLTRKAYWGTRNIILDNKGKDIDVKLKDIELKSKEIDIEMKDLELSRLKSVTPKIKRE